MASQVLRGIGLGVSGLAVVAATAAVTVAGTLSPAAEPRVTEVEAAEVGTGASTWACAPVPEPVVPTDEEDDPDLGAQSQVATMAELTAIGSAQSPSLVAGELGQEASDGGGSGTLTTLTEVGVTGPYVGVVEPASEDVPLVGGLRVARSDTGDMRSLAVVPCEQPVSSAVLVGGSTELGSSARLVLTNPGETVATVTVTGWGATGPLPQIAPVVVPPGTSEVLLLETISLEPRLAVRIDVDGGSVVPTIQDSALDGLVPAGTELVGPAADPATDLVIGGTSIVDNEASAAVLRLVNPSSEAATARVEMLGPDGAEVLDGADDTVIEPGTVADISLNGLPTGQYGLRITSDVPITGAVRLERIGTAGEDDPDTRPVEVAWLPAREPVDRGIVPIPSDLVQTVRLTVTNPADEAVEVDATSYDATGEVLAEETVPVPAGTTVVVDVPPDTLATVLEGPGITASALVAASVADGALFSVYPIVDDPHNEQSVAVRVGS